MVDIAILCPIEEEFTAVRKLLTNSSLQTSPINRIPYELGTISAPSGDWKVALVEPITKHYNYELRTFMAIQDLRPEYIFLVGIAGGRKEVRIGDIVVSTKAYDYETGKATSYGVYSRAEAVYNNSEDLLTVARRLARSLRDKGERIHFGSIASGKKIITSSRAAINRFITSHYEDTLAVELEAYGFARIASQQKVQYLNIRGISDLLDDKTSTDNKGYQLLAATQAANFLYQLIQSLPFSRLKQIPEVCAVKYSEKRYRIYQLRNTKQAILLIHADCIEFRSEEKSYTIYQIDYLEYTSMPGDFRKNWVELKFRQNHELITVYISNRYFIPGIRYWIGGSKSLFEQLQRFYVQTEKIALLSNLHQLNLSSP